MDKGVANKIERQSGLNRLVLCVSLWRGSATGSLIMLIKVCGDSEARQVRSNLGRNLLILDITIILFRQC